MDWPTLVLGPPHDTCHGLVSSSPTKVPFACKPNLNISTPKIHYWTSKIGLCDFYLLNFLGKLLLVPIFPRKSPFYPSSSPIISPTPHAPHLLLTQPPVAPPSPHHSRATIITTNHLHIAPPPYPISSMSHTTTSPHHLSCRALARTRRPPYPISSTSCIAISPHHQCCIEPLLAHDLHPIPSPSRRALSPVPTITIA